MMKKIEAIIGTDKLDEAAAALVGEGVDGMCVSEVRHTTMRARCYRYRGAPFTVPLEPVLKIEIVVTDAQLARCVAALHRCISSDTSGVGTVTIQSVDDALHIRSGQRLDRAA